MGQSLRARARVGGGQATTAAGAPPTPPPAWSRMGSTVGRPTPASAQAGPSDPGDVLLSLSLRAGAPSGKSHKGWSACCLCWIQSSGLYGAQTVRRAQQQLSQLPPCSWTQWPADPGLSGRAFWRRPASAGNLGWVRLAGLGKAQESGVTSSPQDREVKLS